MSGFTFTVTNVLILVIHGQRVERSLPTLPRHLLTSPYPAHAAAWRSNLYEGVDAWWHSHSGGLLTSPHLQIGDSELLCRFGVFAQALKPAGRANETSTGGWWSHWCREQDFTEMHSTLSCSQMKSCIDVCSGASFAEFSGMLIFMYFVLGGQLLEGSDVILSGCLFTVLRTCVLRRSMPMADLSGPVSPGSSVV